MFVMRNKQLLVFEEHILGGYISEFDKFLKEEYPLLEQRPGEDRSVLIREYHNQARRCGLVEYDSINVFVICCFVFGLDNLISDKQLIDIFINATYETEPMILFLEKRLKN